jgi:hypothetical protein
MGVAASAAVDYDAFWMLNALVNQYKWHCVGLYNRLRPKRADRLHYQPIIWSMDRLFKTPDDEVLMRLKSFCKPFPGPTGFQGSMFTTFFPYKDEKQEGGGLIDGILRTGALVTVMRSFSSLNQLWNEFRWYLLELRRLHGDPEVRGVEHTYVSRAAALPMGKFIRGLSLTQPIADPNLQGLEDRPTLKRFVDEVYAGQQQLRRSSSGRRSSDRKTRKRDKN